MRSSLLLFLVVGSAVIGGSVVYLCQKKTPDVPPPVAAVPASDATPAAPEKTYNPSAPQSQPVVENPPPVVPAAAPVQPNATAPAKSDAAIACSKAVDALLATNLSAAQKTALFQQLRQNGQLDRAIAELQQRALDLPNNPEIPTTLGEAQLNKVRAVHDDGGSMNDIAILAMQADQNFNAALKIDPSNYEAQFVKASALYYWPANPQTDNQAVQMLSGLIDQQESMAPQPDFAQTYINLGNQYQKIGQSDKAQATWQLGLQKFPNDSTLRHKVNGQ
jgi:tetratricopeptide (TPR) repeat protein